MTELEGLGRVGSLPGWERRLQEAEEKLERVTFERDMALHARFLARSEHEGRARGAMGSTPPVGGADGDLFGGVSQPLASVMLQRPPTQLRPPPIQKFGGNREQTMEFVQTMNRRLLAAEATATMAGLEFAVSHFTGYAAVWWRQFSTDHPDVLSWHQLRPHFESHFELVAAEKVFEQRLLALKQTGSVEQYATEFLQIAVRLPGLPQDFKMRRFAEGACAYLRRVFAEREAFRSLDEMVRYTLALEAALDAHLLRPDATPVVAALPVRGSGNSSSRKPQFRGNCNTCGEYGHRASACTKSRAQRIGAAAGNVTSRGRVNPGRYNGSGRVAHVEAEELSDEELRQGNAQA